MCAPVKNLRFEALDVDDSAETLRPVVDAAFAAADSACCAKRRNAISAAVFETATELGFAVAWGDPLDPDAPDFYVWPAETLKRETVAGYLAEHRAIQIRHRDLSAVS